jgi:hypothetical protein
MKTILRRLWSFVKAAWRWLFPREKSAAVSNFGLTLLRVTPGKRHGWFQTRHGVVRKPLN